MKKVLSLLLSVLMLLSITAGLDFSAYADIPSSGSCGDNVTYTFDSSTGTLIISGTGNMSDSGSLFSSNYLYLSKIIKVIINKGVTSIGDYAFSQCSYLSSVTIPTGVTSIGRNAFYDCRSLSSITIPNSVTNIGDAAFSGCQGLTSITIPNSVTSIGNGLFFACSNLSSLEIPNSVLSIGYSAFYNCLRLTSITIPNSVTSIGYSAFNYCTALENITLSNSITSINSTTFCDCQSLTTITVPDGVTSIGNSAFRGCTELTSIIIPESVKSIDNTAFDNCNKISDIYYTGFESQWNSIKWIYSGDTHSSINNATIHYDYSPTHVHNYVSAVTAPTCTTSGYITYTCSICQKSYKTNVNRLGHSYVAKVTKAATCEESGIKTYTCSRCSSNYTETINALGHNYVQTIKKATLNNYGYSDTVCSRCGDEHYKYIGSPYAELSKTSYTYNGKSKKPKVYVYNDYGQKLSKDWYKVIYPKGRKKVGKYTVKIVFKGPYYAGTIKKTFKIVKKVKKPAQVKGVTSTMYCDFANEKITYIATWKKVKGASGYQIKTGGEDGGGKFWNDAKSIKGASKTKYKYNIAYASDENIAFVKVRAYKKVNGKKVYGKWSKVVYTKQVNIG